MLRLHVLSEVALSETNLQALFSLSCRAFIKGEARNNFLGESVSVWKVCFAFWDTKTKRKQEAIKTSSLWSSFWSILLEKVQLLFFRKDECRRQCLFKRIFFVWSRCLCQAYWRRKSNVWWKSEMAGECDGSKTRIIRGGRKDTASHASWGGGRERERKTGKWKKKSRYWSF